jgi:hypothetical protein
MTITVKNGSEQIWAYPQKEGSVIITAQAVDCDAGVARIAAYQPSKKNLELDIETEDGKRETLKLKFRR